MTSETRVQLEGQKRSKIPSTKATPTSPFHSPQLHHLLLLDLLLNVDLAVRSCSRDHRSCCSADSAQATNTVWRIRGMGSRRR